MAVTAAQIEQALKDITSLNPTQLVETIKNPADLANTLGVVTECLQVLSIFFPQVAGIEDVISLIAEFVPEIEVGVVFLEAVFPAIKDIHISPDLNPQADAQLHVARDLPIK